MSNPLLPFLRPSLIFVLFTAFNSLFAQPPAGYYDAANGLSGAQLKTALSDIIDNHTELGYSTLWIAFEDTDAKPNGKVWDMYSDIPAGTPPYEYTFGTNQCGNYNSEGDCYNREHSFPKSWFNDGSPMYSDLFHLVPTDGYVNGQRGNLPYGEVGNASWTSLNGSKVGNSSYPGYSGQVFEPIDEYKGDFARGYLYMATRYEYLIDDWSSPMLNGTSYPVFRDWALNLLLEWHSNDPVSQKEIDRNNAIFEWQGNRNPFIDNPDYAGLIWGNQVPEIVFTSTPTTEINAGSFYQYTATTTGGNGDPLMISCLQKPDWLTFTEGIDGTATLTGTPQSFHEGDHFITLEATDGVSDVQQQFTITVVLQGNNFQIVSTAVTHASLYQQYSYTIEATVDGEPSNEITYVATTLPNWLRLIALNNGTALLYGYPDDGDIGEYPVSITAIWFDQQAEQSFTIEVSGGGGGESLTETFTLMPAESSAYSDRSWTGDNNIAWNATSARTDQLIDGRAICFRDSSSEPYIQSQTLTGGISSLSFDHQQKFTGSGGEFTIFINDQQIGDPVVVTTEQSSAIIENIGITGDYIIKIVSNGAARLAIDNLSWTTSGAPSTLPLFTDLLHTPSQPQSNEQVDIQATITDPDGSVASAILNYTALPENTDFVIPMNNISGDVYHVSFSFPENAEIVSWFIEATDNEDNTSESPVLFIESLPEFTDFALLISVSGQGYVTPQPGEHIYSEGTQVALTATADPGWVFQNWILDGNDVLENSFTLAMDSDHQAMAIFTDATQVNGLETEPEWLVYPNPAKNQLHLSPLVNPKALLIFNLHGELVISIENPHKTLDISQLAEGMYIVSIINESGTVMRSKLLIER